MARSTISDTPKNVPLSKEALNMLEARRKNQAESYSDILVRALKDNTPAKAKKKIRMSEAGFRSLVRQDAEDFKELGDGYSGGYEW
jgi:hypothetical protein